MCNSAGSIEPGVDPVRMDTMRIGRVLNNLLVNALRHTPAGGHVEVSGAPFGRRSGGDGCGQR